MFGKKFPSFLESESEPKSAGNAFFHVIPVPCEKTVSYGKGTAEGPSAILNASNQLESFDGYSNPSELGIYTSEAVECKGNIEKVLENVEKAVSKTLALKKFPVVLGGEHSISIGTIKALMKYENKFGIVHFDAHADLKDSYEGSSFSHACAMRHAVDAGIPVFQIGIRSMTEDENKFRKQKKMEFINADKIDSINYKKPILPKSFPKKIFFSIDVDGFDPYVFPATGTPEPGGFSWREFFKIAENLLQGRKLIGFDLVELAPIENLHYPEFSAARLIYNLMGMVQRRI